ncbi:hypothetical protein V1511DRAFT_488949 [Dipodascopsis uninucleata]
MAQGENHSIVDIDEELSPELIHNELKRKDEMIRNYAEVLRELNQHSICEICANLMFEPCVVSCGHMFCYACLLEWFGHHKTCPKCRSAVKIRPSISFQSKTIIDTIVSHADLFRLPETEDELSKRREEESARVAKHKEIYGELFPGLFQEVFTDGSYEDGDDGVRRCARCHWELEGNRCLRCFGWNFSDAEDDDSYENNSNSEADYVEDEDEMGINFTEDEDYIGRHYAYSRHNVNGLFSDDDSQADIEIYEIEDDEDDSFIDDRPLDELSEVENDEDDSVTHDDENETEDATGGIEEDEEDCTDDDSEDLEEGFEQSENYFDYNQEDTDGVPTTVSDDESWRLMRSDYDSSSDRDPRGPIRVTQINNGEIEDDDEGILNSMTARNSSRRVHDGRNSTIPIELEIISASPTASENGNAVVGHRSRDVIEIDDSNDRRKRQRLIRGSGNEDNIEANNITMNEDDHSDDRLSSRDRTRQRMQRLIEQRRRRLQRL